MNKRHISDLWRDISQELLTHNIFNRKEHESLSDSYGSDRDFLYQISGITCHFWHVGYLCPLPKTTALDEGKNELTKLYGSRLRLRVCGICISDKRILMVRHRFVGKENVFWSPPGGGMQFGESALDALKREFLEETGLIVEIGKMLFVNEFIAQPLHAVELFFKTEIIEGSVIIGSDPEFSEENQIIREVRFMSMEEIKQLPENHVHTLFRNCDTVEEVLALRGYLVDSGIA